MTEATHKRKLQFSAGPESYTFYACDQHKEMLEKGRVMNFLINPHWPVKKIADEGELGIYNLVASVAWVKVKTDFSEAVGEHNVEALWKALISKCTPLFG